MRKAKALFCVITLSALLCGCTKIPEYSESEGDFFTDLTTPSSEVGENVSDNYTPAKFTVIKQKFISKLNAEGGVYENASERTDGDFDGKGYLRMNPSAKLTHIVNANTPQFYRIIIAARSEKGAAIKLYVKKRAEGAFYIPPAELDDYYYEYDDDFKYYVVDSVYLTDGANVLDLVVEKGTADVDYILVENSENVNGSIYRTGTSSVNPSAGVPTVGAMKYFSEIYGKKVLTAVNVSTGTNAEIEQVRELSGRYPAMRVGELALAVLDDESSKTRSEKETELALEWGKSGGIVAFKWHWYSPNTQRSTDVYAFDAEEALDVPNLDDMISLSKDEMQMLVENGYLSPNTFALINDIDKIAEILKKFDDEKIPVVFEPIPCADSGLYWWGASAETHKGLYGLIFDRLCRYHRLSNLVWVWTGSSTEYFPGTKYCDIIGQTIFENSSSSFAGRLSGLAETFSGRKIFAITACDVLTNPDYESRDNALWLWSAVESGKYLIKEDGTFSSEYNSLSAISSAYNSPTAITKDELPDLRDYATFGIN